jgi:hypothetical protein
MSFSKKVREYDKLQKARYDIEFQRREQEEKDKKEDLKWVSYRIGETEVMIRTWTTFGDRDFDVRLKETGEKLNFEGMSSTEDLQTILYILGKNM